MGDTFTAEEDSRINRRAIEVTIRIGLVLLLVLWCYNIVRPFILLGLWAAILAVAVYPLFERLQSALAGRR